MAEQKYDIRRPESEGGGFESGIGARPTHRSSTPCGAISFFIHRVEDVTALHRAGTGRCREGRERAAGAIAVLGSLVGSMANDLFGAAVDVVESWLYAIGKQPCRGTRGEKHVERAAEQLEGGQPADPEHGGDDAGAAAAAGADRAGAALDLDRGRARARLERAGLLLEGVAELPPVVGDLLQLRQAMMGLVEHTTRAAAPLGEVRVGGRRVGEQIELVIDSAGPQSSSPLEARAVEASLGLALVELIINRHGGDIAGAHEPGAGSRLVLRLPCRP